MQHALLSPSAYSRWSVCPGSIHVPKIDQPINKWAAEGIAAHKEFENALRSKMWIQDLHYDIEEGVRYVKSLEGHRMVETRSEIWKGLGLDSPVIWGTSDVFVYSDREFHVIDLKYGRSHVKADSDQLILYAIGFADLLDWDFEKVNLTIFQPRSTGSKIRIHVLTREQLVDKVEQYREKVKIALDPDAPLVAGDKQCWFCQYKGKCQEFHNYFTASQFEDLTKNENQTQ